MKCTYENVIMENKKKAVSFHIITRKGSASGLFHNKRIWVHHIVGNGSVKGIINLLIAKFKTHLITFTPLINENIKNSIRGEIKICKADNPENPYKEDFEYMECVWK